MNAPTALPSRDTHVVVIGAGIGGLATAARLSQAGLRVTVLERHAAPGGKMRTLPSDAGPVDTGPTVLTMRHVFDDLFETLGERFEDHVALIPQPVIARHFWPDGSTLDLFDNDQANDAAIRAFAGPKAAQQFHAFTARARTLFDGFDAPVMQAAKPTLPALTAHVLANPKLIPRMAPLSTLAKLLKNSFDDPRLAQLFGRYATYVGGSPYHVPALLSLIWAAELRGVWAVKGGMHQLACAIEGLAKDRGAHFHYNAHVETIDAEGTQITGVTLRDGTQIAADRVVFNGDPRALATGTLGPACTNATPQTLRTPRSLSAEVWAFAATPHGPDLAYHNVFFRTDPKPEFDALKRGERVQDPTLYICAMDRATGHPPGTPNGLERFEIIANAPPIGGLPGQEEFSRCQTRTFQTLARFGLRFSPMPERDALTTPLGFSRLFPESNGSLYGQSPHGTMAAFQRPTARTSVQGLYLAGGGAHPGAGVPMATLSGRHAAEAILRDQISTSPSHRMGTPGGISTGSKPVAGVPSRSSPS